MNSFFSRKSVFLFNPLKRFLCFLLIGFFFFEWVELNGAFAGGGKKRPRDESSDQSGSNEAREPKKKKKRKKNKSASPRSASSSSSSSPTQQDYIEDDWKATKPQRRLASPPFSPSSSSQSSSSAPSSSPFPPSLSLSSSSSSSSPSPDLEGEVLEQKEGEKKQNKTFLESFRHLNLLPMFKNIFGNVLAVDLFYNIISDYLPPIMKTYDSSTCFLNRAKKSFTCWGGNYEAHLKFSIDKEIDFVIGTHHTCALLEDKTVNCKKLDSPKYDWEEGFFLEEYSGNPDLEVFGARPTDVPSNLGAVKSLVAGSLYTCALLGNGQVKCWGDIRRDVLKDLKGVKSIIGGPGHACALLEGGQIHCWGNYKNEDVNGVKDLNNLKSLIIGSAHNCALLENRIVSENGDVLKSNAVECWGSNEFQQLNVPDELKDGSKNIKSITAGAEHTCALLENNTVQCWGNNESGQLKVPYILESGSRMLKPVNSIVAGAVHTCALFEDGTVICWGNIEEPFGESPDELEGVESIVAGAAHSCALFKNNTVHCWGTNLYREPIRFLHNP